MSFDEPPKMETLQSLTKVRGKGGEIYFPYTSSALCGVAYIMENPNQYGVSTAGILSDIIM